MEWLGPYLPALMFASLAIFQFSGFPVAFVLGGIGLSGGQGGVRNVLVGTVLVGILINGMTILNFSYTSQNLIKSVILLGALALDAIINPRDEQTSQSGDI